MATISTTIKINDAFSGPLDRLSSGLSKSQSGFAHLKNALGGGIFDRASKSSGSLVKSMAGGVVVGGLVNKGIGLIKDNLGGAIDRVDTLNNSSRAFQNMGFSAQKTSAAIKQLDQAVTGLPTPIDVALRNTQLLAASTGDIGKSTQIFKAMNDGILGFGGSTAQVDNAVVQLSQAFSNGKVDAQTWNSMIQSGMGPVLTAVAKKMGMTTGQLKDSLSKGKTSVKDFQDALIQLDQKGGGGLKSLSQIAADSTKGLKTSLANFQTGIKNALGTGLIAPLAKAGLTDTINNITKQIKASGPKIASVVSGSLQYLQPVFDNLKAGFANFINGFQSSGALSSVANMFKEIADAAIELTSTLNSGSGKNNLFTQLGQISGSAIQTVADAIGGLAKVIGSLSVEQLKSLGEAFLVLKFGVRGLALAGVVQALSKLNSVSPGTIRGIASALTNLGTAMAAMKVGNDVGEGIFDLGKRFAEAKKGLTEIKSAFSSTIGNIKGQVGTLKTAFAGIKNAISGGDGIGSALKGIGTALSGSLWPVIGIIAIVTAVIAGAVAAWKTNFMGFRDTLSRVFSNLGYIFQPVISSFQRLGSALGPVVSVLGKAFMAIGVVAVGTIGVGLAVAADAISAFSSACAAAVYGVKSFVQALHALGDAMVGNFSGAKRDLQDAVNAAKDFGSAFRGIGSSISDGATVRLFSVLGQLGSKTKSAAAQVNGTKFKPTVDMSDFNTKMATINSGKAKGKSIKITPTFDLAGMNQKLAAISSGKAKGAKVTPQLDAAGFSQQMSQLSGKKAKGAKVTPTLDTSGFSTKMANIGVGKSKSVKIKTSYSTPKAPKLAKIKAPKVGRPTVPTPKAPKMSRIRAPKVGKPRVPQPTMPHVRRIPAPKVGKPHVPQPSMPHLGTIPAPHVARPSMGGVVSAVSSGMSRAASAARAAGSALSSAVSSAVSRAASAGRAAAGAMVSVGQMIGQGLASGMMSEVGAVAAAADALVAQADRAARAKAKVHSPSKLFAEIGDYMGQGMAVGMNGTAKTVAQAGENMINAATSATGAMSVPTMNGSSLSSNTINSGSINPSSLVTAPANTSNNSSTQVTFGSGAIVINSSGNAAYDADTLLEQIAQKIMAQGDKAL